MAQDVITGEIIDPYDGRKDLQNHIIKATKVVLKKTHYECTGQQDFQVNSILK